MSNNLEIVEKQVDDIIPYQNNPRLISDEAVKEVSASIDRFGFRQPIVVDTENVIVAGHTRYLAAIELGMSSVPVHVMDGNIEDILAYRLSDNKTKEITEWDMGYLVTELEEIIRLGKEAGMEYEKMVPGLDDENIETLIQHSMEGFSVNAEAIEAAERFIDESTSNIQRTEIKFCCPHCQHEFYSQT